jgi:hypothetical protein
MSNELSINFTREAFFHPMNLGFLFLASLFAFVMNDVGAMSQFILATAIGMEFVYLGTIPKSDYFRKLVQRRKLQERNSAREEKDLFYSLDTKSQKRFLIMKHISDRIRENFDKFPSTSQGLATTIKGKIQGLLTNYMLVLDSYTRFQQYVTSTREQHLTNEIAEATQEVKEATSDKLRDIKRRRLAILKKRLERLIAAREKMQICESQLETIEDAIRYIYEQSITMSNPEEIGLQLDTLLTDVEETVTIIEDIEDDALPGYSLIDKMPDEIESKPKGKVRTR